jgi:hypothetical protein
MANDRLASDPSWTIDEKVIRCRAKAQAYAHSAELAQQTGDDIEVRIGFLQRDVEYWRMRCPVTEQDVDGRGVTREQATAWMDANGFVREPAFDEPTWRTGEGGFYGIFSREESDSIAHLCNSAGKRVGKPAQQVLDEMAAIVSEDKS